jgi:hypothetical protein
MPDRALSVMLLPDNLLVFRGEGSNFDSMDIIKGFSSDFRLYFLFEVASFIKLKAAYQISTAVTKNPTDRVLNVRVSAIYYDFTLDNGRTNSLATFS